MNNIDTSDAPQFNARGLSDFLSFAIADDVPPMVWGPPGCGKSQSIAAFAEREGYHLVHRHWGQYAIHSASGVVVPDLEKGTSRNTMPDYIEESIAASEAGKRVMLFIDEMPNAPRDVTAVSIQLIDERRVGRFRLPDDTVVVAAGNRPSDGAHVCNMAATVANRLAHGVFTGASVTEFCEWGEATGRLSVEVMGYLGRNPGALYDFEKNRCINNTHRAWEKVSALFERHRRREGCAIDPAFLGQVSSRIMQRTAFDMEMTAMLLDRVAPFAAVIADPARAPLPSERGFDSGDELVATFMQLRLLNASLSDSVEEARAVATYIARLGAELRAAFLAMVMRKSGEEALSVKVRRVFQGAFKDELVLAADKAFGR